jgi:hypothetical protein
MKNVQDVGGVSTFVLYLQFISEMTVRLLMWRSAPNAAPVFRYVPVVRRGNKYLKQD